MGFPSLAFPARSVESQSRAKTLVERLLFPLCILVVIVWQSCSSPPLAQALGAGHPAQIGQGWFCFVWLISWLCLAMIASALLSLSRVGEPKVVIDMRAAFFILILIALFGFHSLTPYLSRPIDPSRLWQSSPLSGPASRLLGRPVRILKAPKSVVVLSQALSSRERHSLSEVIKPVSQDWSEIRVHRTWLEALGPIALFLLGLGSLTLVITWLNYRWTNQLVGCFTDLGISLSCGFFLCYALAAVLEWVWVSPRVYLLVGLSLLGLRELLDSIEPRTTPKTSKSYLRVKIPLKKSLTVDTAPPSTPLTTPRGSDLIVHLRRNSVPQKVMRSLALTFPRADRHLCANPNPFFVGIIFRVAIPYQCADYAISFRGKDIGSGRLQSHSDLVALSKTLGDLVRERTPYLVTLDCTALRLQRSAITLPTSHRLATQRHSLKKITSVLRHLVGMVPSIQDFEVVLDTLASHDGEPEKLARLTASKLSSTDRMETQHEG